MNQPFPSGAQPTRLIELPALARRANVARVFVKSEGERQLGNFKSLGGLAAGLRALARASGRPSRLICASDGNHGLSVAVAARQAGAKASVYLPIGAAPARAGRIEAQGGQIVWISGTYDDAVREAEAAAARGDGLLIPDTTADPSDRVVKDVMDGYGQICRELAVQLPEPPTHLFVQAGVGGLAAALAEGLHAHMRAPSALLVVEPEGAACVAAALAAGRPVRIPGDLRTSAEMLSCGLASAPALEILLRHDARSVIVGEDALACAVDLLRSSGGPDATPSGAAGLAGLLCVASCAELRAEHGLASSSSVLLVATEGPVEDGGPSSFLGGNRGV